MPTIASLAIAGALAAIPYQYGSGRWRSEWTTTTYGIGLMFFVVLMPWFVVSTAVGAPGVLVPVTMILFAGTWGVGRWAVLRRMRSGK